MPPPILDSAATFGSLADAVGLDGRLRKAVMRQGLTRPTLVQSKCLPLAMNAGRNLLVRARTGSGKTLAYALPVLQKVLQQSPPRTPPHSVVAIVLVPTRELCAQVHDTFVQLTYYCADVVHMAVLSVGRGDPDERERQEARLRDAPHILIATPNALWTQLQKPPSTGSSSLKEQCSALEILVLDEADLILSFGYETDVRELLPCLPRIYQGMMLSATLQMEGALKQLVLLPNPVVVTLEEEETEPRDARSGPLKQFYLALPNADKRLLLYVFLKLGLLKGKGLFFVNTTDAGYRWKLFFEQFHIRSAVLNAELPFRSRMNIIEQFNIGNFDYLIATDASTDAAAPSSAPDSALVEEKKDAAPLKKSKRSIDCAYGVSRGLDFRHVAFVVNVDLPPNPQSYAHRIGRTARAGAKGVAVSLINSDAPEELALLQEIQASQPRIPRAGASTDTLAAADVVADDDDAFDQPQPVPLDFPLASLEGFRYRVEDVARAVTKVAVRQTRVAEFSAELRNSERLQAHFADDPQLQQLLLAHDRTATHVSRVQAHLQHVPNYLLPRGMQVANLSRRKKKRVRRATKEKDPLRTLDGDVTFDGVEDEDPHASFLRDEEEVDAVAPKKAKTLEEDDSKVFNHTQDGTGQSTAGRSAWKEKHRKGKFNKKTKRLADRKHKAPLGI